MLVRSWTLRQWLVKYAVNPLSEKNCVSVYSFCTEPWGDSHREDHIYNSLMTPFLICYNPVGLMKVTWGLLPWGAATKAVAPDMCTSSCQRDADDLVLSLEQA